MAEDYSSRRQKLTNALALVQELISLNDRAEMLNIQMQAQNVPVDKRDDTIDLLFAGAGPPKALALDVVDQTIMITSDLFDLDPTGLIGTGFSSFEEYFNNAGKVEIGFPSIVGRNPTQNEFHLIMHGTTIYVPVYVSGLSDLPECGSPSISDRLVNILNGAIVEGIDWTA